MPSPTAHSMGRNRMRSTSVRSCETTTRVMPSSAASRTNRSITFSALLGSSDAVGSSASTIFGPWASARATAARCRSPIDTLRRDPARQRGDAEEPQDFAAPAPGTARPSSRREMTTFSYIAEKRQQGPCLQHVAEVPGARARHGRRDPRFPTAPPRPSAAHHRGRARNAGAGRSQGHRQQVEAGALAAAARAEQRHPLAGGDRQPLDAQTERLAGRAAYAFDVFQADDRQQRWPPQPPQGSTSSGIGIDRVARRALGIELHPAVDIVVEALVERDLRLHVVDQRLLLAHAHPRPGVLVEPHDPALVRQSFQVLAHQADVLEVARARLSDAVGVAAHRRGGATQLVEEVAGIELPLLAGLDHLAQGRLQVAELVLGQQQPHAEGRDVRLLEVAVGRPGLEHARRLGPLHLAQVGQLHGAPDLLGRLARACRQLAAGRRCRKPCLAGFCPADRT